VKFAGAMDPFMNAAYTHDKNATAANATPILANTLVVIKCGLSRRAVDAAPSNFATSSTRSLVARIQYAKNPANSAKRTPPRMDPCENNITLSVARLAIFT